MTVVELSPLELGPEPHHRVENRSPELSGMTLGIAHVTRELAELAERAGDLPLADPPRRIPRRNLESHLASLT